MTMKFGFAALILLSLTCAMLEGLWNAVPPALVQFNGLVLLLSALLFLGFSARLLFHRLLD